MNNIVLRSDTKIHPFLEGVVTELARKRPKWTIESSQYEEATKFYISEGEFSLGNLWMESKYVHSNRHHVYAIENWRIREERQRGTSITTKKPREILKAIDKYFFQLTPSEELDIGHSDAAHVLHDAAASARYILENSVADLVQPMLNFVQNNWTDFIDTLDTNKQIEALLLTKKQQDAEQLKELNAAISNCNKHLTVFIQGDKYTVRDNQGTRVYESASLPETIRTKIGLLKLIENKHALPEVGIRVNDVYVIQL